MKRIYAHARIYDDFVERALAAAGSWRAGDPAAEETTLGPLANPDTPAELDAPVMVGPHSVVGARTVVRRALVLPGATVAPGLVVEDTVHGSGEDVLRAWLR